MLYFTMTTCIILPSVLGIANLFGWRIVYIRRAKSNIHRRIFYFHASLFKAYVLQCAITFSFDSSMKPFLYILLGLVLVFLYCGTLQSIPFFQTFLILPLCPNHYSLLTPFVYSLPSHYSK